MKNQNFQVRHNDTIIRLVIQRLQKPYIHPSKGNCADNTYSSKGIEAIQQNTHYASSLDQRGKTLKKLLIRLQIMKNYMDYLLMNQYYFLFHPINIQKKILNSQILILLTKQMNYI